MDEIIPLAAFISAVLLLVYVEIELMFDLSCKSFLARLFNVIRDFRSGKFYKPWKSATPLVIVSNKNQFTELSEARCLSQRAAYADMFGFKHTMNQLDHHDHKVLRTRLYSRLLQVNGPAQLQQLFPYVKERLQTKLTVELVQGRRLSDGTVSLPLARTAQRLASELMSLIFFGQELSSNEEFSKSLLRYPNDLVKCMAAFQITPSFLSPMIHGIITQRGKAMHTIQNSLMEVMGPNRANWNEPEAVKRLTIVHQMSELTDGSDYWSPETLSQSLLGIWFAASHQPWMNLHFIILELCARKDWQALLRQEVEKQAPLNYEKLERLPLLDSFIKETVRLHPLDTRAIRRKALETYTFSDGSLQVPAGATVCVSAYDLMHDDKVYPQPDEFSADRFVPKGQESRQRKFTDISENFPVWGYGSLACPGRFHAAFVIKMILSQLLLRYELSLEDENARRKWSWETFTMPYQSTRILLKERMTV